MELSLSMKHLSYLFFSLSDLTDCLSYQSHTLFTALEQRIALHVQWTHDGNAPIPTIVVFNLKNYCS